MEFNNIRNFVEKFSVPDQDMEAPPDLNGVAKMYWTHLQKAMPSASTANATTRSHN